MMKAILCNAAIFCIVLTTNIGSANPEHGSSSQVPSATGYDSPKTYGNEPIYNWKTDIITFVHKADDVLDSCSNDVRSVNVDQRAIHESMHAMVRSYNRKNDLAFGKKVPSSIVQKFEYQRKLTREERIRNNEERAKLYKFLVGEDYASKIEHKGKRGGDDYQEGGNDGYSSDYYQEDDYDEGGYENREKEDGYGNREKEDGYGKPEKKDGYRNNEKDESTENKEDDESYEINEEDESYEYNDQEDGYGNNDSEGAYGKLKKVESYGMQKEEGAYGKQNEEGAYGTRKEEIAYGKQKEGGSYGKQKERDAYVKRKEEIAYGKQKEGDAYVKRKEEIAYGKQKEGDAYVKRKEEIAYGKQKEGDAYVKRKEEIAYGKQKEGDAYVKRKEEIAYGKQKEGGAYGKQNKEGAYGKKNKDHDHGVLYHLAPWNWFSHSKHKMYQEYPVVKVPSTPLPEEYQIPEPKNAICEKGSPSCRPSKESNYGSQVRKWH